MIVSMYIYKKIIFFSFYIKDLIYKFRSVLLFITKYSHYLFPEQLFYLLLLTFYYSNQWKKFLLIQSKLDFAFYIRLFLQKNKQVWHQQYHQKYHPIITFWFYGLTNILFISSLLYYCLPNMFEKKILSSHLLFVPVSWANIFSNGAKKYDESIDLICKLLIIIIFNLLI